MTITKFAAGGLAALSIFASASAQNADLAAIFTAPIGIERETPVSAVPLDLRMGKLFLDAEVNGQSREFIFDTGSPTILSREFADTLDLEIMGQNTGVDANGTPVTMDIVVLDTVRLGGVTFSGVPALVFDFTGVDAGGCIFSGGVIGSELLPGSAWRIDTGAEELAIAADAGILGADDPQVRARLYDFGYPHAPVIDYAVGEVSDKALFDTGSSDVVTLFGPVAANASVRAAIVNGSLVQGLGYEGVSAGGEGEIGDLVRFTLEDFEIDGGAVGSVRATTRGAPPSLVGAGIFATHVVTLDYPANEFLLEARDAPDAARSEAGYAINYVGETATIMRVFEGSPASEAGLRPGDRVITANGRSLQVTPDNPVCPSITWLAESFDAAGETELTIERDGEHLDVRIPAAEAQ